ncbi:hypothetical protein RB195_011308 [Necator americanus]|uniref:Reverse transcriptase domain-containing protein n=1 Tax=Necator americanus TaxID=51031 RepID=A0ABR1D517_NECAM
MPLCLTFIDLKKAFDSVETEVVAETLDNQGVPTQHISGTNADRIRRNMWIQSSAESAKDDIHAERMGCPIHAQRNEHVRMHRLRLPELGIERDDDLTPSWAGGDERLGERIRATRM